MSESETPRLFDEAIERLKAKAGGSGAVTSSDIVDAFGELHADIDEIETALHRIGLVWEDPNPGPPVFPPGYDRLRIVKTKPD